MAFSPELRSAFIGNVCAWLEKYNLDGVDIDWEYPVGPEWGQEIKSRPEDRQNWIILLKDLRAALDKLGSKTGKRYSLSACVPASLWFVTANDAAAAAEIVDALKLMAYDYCGAWSQFTGHHSNLGNNPSDPAWGGWSTEQALNAYISANVPPQKIMLGAGFYGRVFHGTAPGANGDGLFQPFDSSSAENGDISWDKIKLLLQSGTGYSRYWDSAAQSPYIYNGDTWICYSDEEAVRLIGAYAKSKNLGGVFNWEYAHDMNAELLKALFESTR
jgi:chitinase